MLLGVGAGDTRADADYLAEKIVGLRIFEDAGGKMNLSVAEVGGALLVVSQFTLYGDARKGKRPSFDAAAPPARRANSTNILWRKSAPPVCAAKPDAFRKRCRWNWSTKGR